ncbi:MAG: arginine--tRNA ligase [Aquificae bacterium]|nr:arginine--tRNA ligase [Aquificota bacterium]
MKELVKQKLQSALLELYNTAEENFKIEKPKDPEHGDLSTNLAFLLARKLKKPPQKIAQELANHLSKDPHFKSVEALKGFVNFRLSQELLKEEFKKFLLSPEEYLREDIGKGKKVQVEFVSANPTGPLHLGHGRGAVVGDTLSRLLEFFNYDVVREYYINDAGRQVRLLGISVLYRYMEECQRKDEELFRELERTFNEEGYRGEYVKEIARRLRKHVGDSLCFPARAELSRIREELISKEEIPLNYLKKYEPGDAIELVSDFALDILLEEIRKDLLLMGVEFDVWFSERSLHESGLIDELVKLLKEKGYVYEKDGALWLKTSQFGDDKDRVIRRSDGTYTYFAADIAYHYDKLKRGFDKVINVWGADHHGYIPRVKASLKMLGAREDWLEVLLIQMVKLFRGGKEVKMSKRAGNFVTLRELLEEVGPDAVRFTFLTKRSDTPLDFDVEKVKEKSSENPVFYVQYAHARISGILREYEKLYGKKPSPLELAPYVSELTQAEEKLLKLVLFLKDELREITQKREPHLLTYYLIELAREFHHYYNHNRILGTQEKTMLSRLALALGVKEAIKTALGLMGVSAPERM